MSRPTIPYSYRPHGRFVLMELASYTPWPEGFLFYRDDEAGAAGLKAEDITFSLKNAVGFSWHHYNSTGAGGWGLGSTAKFQVVNPAGTVIIEDQLLCASQNGTAIAFEQAVGWNFNGGVGHAHFVNISGSSSTTKHNAPELGALYDQVTLHFQDSASMWAQRFTVAIEYHDADEAEQAARSHEVALGIKVRGT